MVFTVLYTWWYGKALFSIYIDFHILSLSSGAEGV